MTVCRASPSASRAPSVAFGGKPLDFRKASGYRVGGGVAFTEDGSFSLEAGWLQLEKRSVLFGVASDALGTPVIAG